MSAILTIVGLYEYDPTVYDNLSVPDGIDKDTLIGVINHRCAEFSLVYPDLDYMKYAIGVWSKKNEWTFNKWYNAINIEYAPLDNYNRKEVMVEEGSNRGKDVESGKDTYDDTTQQSVSGNIENKQSSFDSETYQPDNTEISSSTSNGKTNSTRNRSNTTEREDANRIERTLNVSGNIGVTTSQNMLLSELNIAKWNLYDQIADLFASEFCIMIY